MKKSYLTKAQKKKLLLKELEKSLGIVSNACKAANISRTSFYQYCKEDEKFQASVDDISEIAIDYVESQNLKNIKNGDKTSIIFYLKTKAKHRGYVEKTEQDVVGDIGLNINIVDKNNDK